MVQRLIGLLIIMNLYGIIIKKNSKIIIIFSTSIIWAIMGLNTYTSDYPFYADYYNTQVFSMSFESGFILLSNFLYLVGADYQKFLMVFFLIGILVMILAAKDFHVNWPSIILLYSLTQIYMDTNEIRQFMAYCFFALAMSQYAKKSSKFQYCIWIIVAILFHRSAAILLPFPFLFAGIKNREKILKIYFAVIVFFCGAVFMNGNRIPGLNTILIAFGLQDKAIYFETSTRYGFLLFWAAYFSNMLVVYFAKKEINKNDGNYDDYQKKYVKNLWEFLLYTSFAMPLCMLNSEFLRYYRFSVYPVILVISVIVYKKAKHRLKLCTIRLLPFFLCTFYLIAYNITFQHWRVVDEVLKNNILNDFLK
nr:EpsG family protein [uncultured Acetatifactor sp.]